MRTLRLACHVHSDWSYDGSLSLDEIARLFGRLGYDGVLLSEHDLGWDAERFGRFVAACAAAGEGGCVLVPGVEYSDAANDVHVLVWGCDRFLGAGLDTTALLDRVHEHGGFAVLAHPRRRRAGETLGAEVCARFEGIEVWNRKYDGVMPDDDARELAEEAGAVPFVGLDFHTRRQLFPLAMSLPVAAGETIGQALRSGRIRARALGASLPHVTSRPGRALLGTTERARRVGAAVRAEVRDARRR